MFSAASEHVIESQHIHVLDQAARPAAYGFSVFAVVGKNLAPQRVITRLTISGFPSSEFRIVLPFFLAIVRVIFLDVLFASHFASPRLVSQPD
jgi:hypothetical protein